MKCPPDEDWAQYLLGQVGEPDATRLDDHLAGCPTCLSATAGVERKATDPLFDLVREIAVRRTTDPTLVNPAHTPVPPGYDRSSLPNAVEPSKGRIGTYRIEGVLGRGGMGVVYLARHDRLSRAVALKVLPAHASQERIARFRREAEAIAAIRHPNIVQVFEIGEHDGSPFLVMECVPGGSLSEKLAVAPLRALEAARLIEQTARAVAAAHQQGVIHRDLKPANILLDPPVGPKVADFGLAKVRESDPDGFETDTGALLGTPCYMAPEQAEGAATVGPAADVYGLGAVLYECLTGRPPFRASSPLETLHQVLTLDPVPPRRLEPAVPRDLETIALKCLEKTPAQRYSSADALADDLGRFLRDEPVFARPVGRARRTWKWARRRPTTAALLAACAVAVTALVGVTAVYAVRLQVEVDRANAEAATAAQQAELAKANAEEARRQQARAADNYHSARDALRKMLARLEVRRAGQIPQLKELQRDQLEEALRFYEGILAGPDDSNPELRLDLALARTELAGIQYQLGRVGPGVEQFRRAIDSLEGLPPEYRTRADCRSGLISSYGYLASTALADRRVPEAERLHRQALAEAEELVAADFADPIRQENLARAVHNLAVLFQLTDRRREAEPYYLRAIAIRTASIERHPDNAAYSVGLAETLLNFGLIQLQSDLFAPAGESFRKAERYLLPLVEAHPADDGYALSLAGLYINWGHLFRYAFDNPKALAKYDAAVRLADAVVAREPRYTTARHRSLEAHGARAVMLDQVGRYAESVADWDRVVELGDEAARSNYRIRRAGSMGRGGLHVRAVAEVYEIARIPGLSDDDRYTLVSFLALAVDPARADPTLGVLAAVAAAEGHAAAAVQFLRRLHEAGFFRNPERTERLQADVRLNSLRSRTDFRRLLADVANEPKP